MEDRLLRGGVRRVPRLLRTTNTVPNASGSGLSQGNLRARWGRG